MHEDPFPLLLSLAAQLSDLVRGLDRLDQLVIQPGIAPRLALVPLVVQHNIECHTGASRTQALPSITGGTGLLSHDTSLLKSDSRPFVS